MSKSDHVLRANNHPEDGNCNVFRNIKHLSKFDVAHARKPKLYNLLQPPKSKNTNSLHVAYITLQNATLGSYWF
jgi:hypothetical protein